MTTTPLAADDAPISFTDLFESAKRLRTFAAETDHADVRRCAERLAWEAEEDAWAAVPAGFGSLDPNKPATFTSVDCDGPARVEVVTCPGWPVKVEALLPDASYWGSLSPTGARQLAAALMAGADLAEVADRAPTVAA